MPKTLPRLADLDREIAEAKRELDECRAEWVHSPNAERLQVVDYAEMRLNRLLDRRYAER